MKSIYSRAEDTSRRGQPLVVLIAILVLWVAVRVATFEVPFAEPRRAHGPVPLASVDRDRSPALDRNEPFAGSPASPAKHPAISEPGSSSADLRPPFAAPSALPAPWFEGSAAPAGLRADAPLVAPTGTKRLPPPIVAGHAVMALAGLMPMPREAATMGQPGWTLSQSPESAANRSRWSGDAWLLARQDTTTPITSGRGSYGRSQAGAVLRYDLAPDMPQRPQAYGRMVRALVGPPGAEAALGLSARPIGFIPVRVAVEGRALLDGPAAGEVRPAAFAHTELPPVELPQGLRGEAYAQAGYVDGQFATAFVDGQARVDRAILQEPLGEIRAGAGVWGGAQRGIERLDIGPGASVTLDLGQGQARASVDYRFRVAGRAEPSSGVAVTLSTGF